jgi:uncharacterized protein YecE (DUF72 family)
MDFGKLPSIAGVDFSLPPDPERNAAVLDGLEKPVAPALYIGPTGYNMRPWLGKWYPPGAPEKRFLNHYAEQFNTIEFNTTHYRIPDYGTVDRWREAVPADFRFCPKIPQTVSHARDLGLSGNEMPLFCEAVKRLAPVLGCCFIQLPPQFIPRDANVLARFLEFFSPKIPLAVEVRNAAFFQGGKEAEAYFALLEKMGVATVITDVAGRRDVCHCRLSNGTAMIRFVGNAVDGDLHPTDRDRVREWAGRLRDWFSAGLHEAYFFTHEPDNLLGPELTAFCWEIFREAMPNVKMRGPKPVGGQQGSLF